MDERAPPRLMIPTASASPSGQYVTAHTGRPTMWTPSALRKMIRLYVYTDLSVSQIIKVVHHGESAAQAPGKDSANKKLNAMLDKQPRWLRPTSSNMVERLDELANSPTRTSPAIFPAITRPHSASDPSPYSHQARELFQSHAASASPFALSPHSALTPEFASRESVYTPSFDESISDVSYQGFRERSEGGPIAEEALMNFVRKTTFMSCSTDHTTGSFQGLLEDKTQPYVQAVRRLVKRFTIPVNHVPAMSDVPEGEEDSSWVNEADCPAPYFGVPFPLPGDYVNESLMTIPERCAQNSESHNTRHCLCAGRDALSALATSWVMSEGQAPQSQRILTHGPRQDDLSLRDSCGNTLLHFIAASNSSLCLLRIMAEGSCDSILNTTNTAGQTFAHLLRAPFLQHAGMHQFFDALHAKGFNMASKDHYGRTVFHMLLFHGVPPQNVEFLLRQYGTQVCNTRDAFGVSPIQTTDLQPPNIKIEPELMEIDEMPNVTFPFVSSTNPEQRRFVESHILERIRRSDEDPSLEDDIGGNGLHCLASATLSTRSVAERNIFSQSSTPERGKPRCNDLSPGNELDSSVNRMQFRERLVQGLLSAGVDPNHYDLNGNTPLMAFAAELPEDDDYTSGPSMLKALINGGANVHARNRHGETALHIAVRCGRKRAVKALVESGANVHARDADGRSVLEVADVKVQRHAANPRLYAHFEACRAWLSGNNAVQEPTVLQEWGS